MPVKTTTRSALQRVIRLAGERRRSPTGGSPVETTTDFLICGPAKGRDEYRRAQACSLDVRFPCCVPFR
jgi:hypothetical protein